MLGVQNANNTAGCDALTSLYYGYLPINKYMGWRDNMNVKGGYMFLDLADSIANLAACRTLL